MTKTEAIRTARRAVSIHGARTSWVVIGPYRSNDIRGRPPSGIPPREKARAVAASWKAEVALGLMGRFPTMRATPSSATWTTRMPTTASKRS